MKQGSTNFSVKGQMVTILSFAGHMVSVARTHFKQGRLHVNVGLVGFQEALFRTIGNPLSKITRQYPKCLSTSRIIHYPFTEH